MVPSGRWTQCGYKPHLRLPEQFFSTINQGDDPCFTDRHPGSVIYGYRDHMMNRISHLSRLPRLSADRHRGGVGAVGHAPDLRRVRDYRPVTGDAGLDLPGAGGRRDVGQPALRRRRRISSGARGWFGWLRFCLAGALACDRYRPALAALPRWLHRDQHEPGRALPPGSTP